MASRHGGISSGHGKSTASAVGSFDVIKGFHGTPQFDSLKGNSVVAGDGVFDQLTVTSLLDSQGTTNLAGPNTIDGALTVNVGPVQFNVPVRGQPAVDADEYALKGYVDSLFGSGMMIIAAVRGFYDVSGGDPVSGAPWVDGNRVIQSVTSGSFTTNYIYARVSGVWTSASDNPPRNGYFISVTDAPWTGQWLYNSGTDTWNPFVIDHTSLLNKGTYTHAQIDSHISNQLSPQAHVWLGQDVRASAEVQFANSSISGGTSTRRAYEAQASVAVTFAGVGPTVIQTWTPQGVGTSGSWNVELVVEGTSAASAGAATIKKTCLVVSDGVTATATEIDSTEYLTGNLAVAGVRADLTWSSADIAVSVTGAVGVTATWSSKIKAIGAQLP